MHSHTCVTHDVMGMIPNLLQYNVTQAWSVHPYRTARNSPRGPRKYNYFSASRGVHREGTSCKDGIASSRQAIIKTLQREQLV